jgi:hypothetical protein
MNRVPLEIIAEAEVPQHLEERVVISRPPHVIDIARPQTLLASRRPREFELHLPQKMVLELVHARRREQHRRIPSRHKHVARTPGVPLRFEKRQIFFAEFVGFHRITNSRAMDSRLKSLFPARIESV